MTDLTKGSTLKQIFFFAIPYLIGNLFQQFYNVADMFIVGRTLDASAYAAVGATGSLVWFATGAIQSLTLGFSVILAQLLGGGEKEKLKKAFGASITLSAIISVAVSALSVLFARPILELLQTPADIIDRSHSYLIWIFAGLAATALFIHQETFKFQSKIGTVFSAETDISFLSFGSFHLQEADAVLFQIKIIVQEIMNLVAVHRDKPISRRDSFFGRKASFDHILNDNRHIRFLFVS